MQNQSQQGNKSAASLAFATMLSEQLMRQQNPMQVEESEEEMPQEKPTEEAIELEESPEEEPVEEVTDETELDPEPEEPSFVEDLKSMITEGFENIKDMFKKEDSKEELDTEE